MARPYYENAKDLENEARVVERLCAIWCCTYIKLPLRYGFDFGILRGDKVVSALEVKRRHIEWGYYPDIILSAGKVMDGLQLLTLDIVPLFVVATNSGVYMYKITHDTKTDCHIGIGGRTDRDDWQDIEPVFHIPVGKFKRIRI